ncbi:ABC transporter ATP-binding protein [Bifidobacterium sp. UTBIF-78]|uniref:ABC transporter ATP-binding protein n=1 Tax=Bifidobacterium sp. UTBIF-78 TaxID=1465263 RepID=UPI001127BC3A|nr:ABC transporter ATP-binding protein [Bifidobacterium sp. UTBIF-78]TPF92198.1 spermidine/putrescine ABC transporter ATP-binding protein [Bifidobacterium sp. UTBIF-78]
MSKVQPLVARDPEVESRESGLTINRAFKVFQSAEGKEVRAINDVSLAIRQGEFFILLGPSGCGKTTLLRSIAGLESLDAGEIYLGDQRIDQLPPYDRPVNTVFQSYALFPHLTVAQNVAFGLEMEKKPKAEIAKTVQEMLDLVHLGEFGGRKPNQLSGGQQQRVALARSLAKRPKVLLLDESLSALDFKLRRQMQVELKRIQRETGITFVFVTHDQEEALSMGDHIAVFSKGRPEQVGTPEEIYNEPANRFVADFIGDINFVDAVKSAEGEITVEGVPFRVKQDISALPVGAQISAAIRPERITLTAPRETALTGTVETLMFMGADVRCEVRLTDGTALLVRLSPPYDTAVLHEGATVSVEVEAEHMRVVER